MVEALAIVVVEGILKEAWSLAANEFVLAWGYKEKLTNLYNTLTMINAKLRSSEGKESSEGVKEWLIQLKDVVDKADNMLDEVRYETLRLEIKKRDRTARMVPCFPSLKKLNFRRKNGHNIEDITTELARVNGNAAGLGLTDEHAGPSVDSLYRDTDSGLDEFKIVGRENDTQGIIELLTRSGKEEKLMIVPIVGMGGIGKTTLAKSVFNDQKIKNSFGVTTWLCVSIKVDITTLLSKIYESVVGKKCEVTTRENLIANLKMEFGGKRYLLVLDDVWDEKREYWDDFKSCMLKLNSQDGSGILLTARYLEIGTHDMSKNSYALEELSYDECWRIFEERAFVAREVRNPELVKTGKEIVKKCRGLPLLVTVIGGMLRGNSDEKKWSTINENEVWDIEGVERVQSIMKLSFDNLPTSSAKKCFAFCSIYEKDVVIQRQEVIRLWMALGLLQADETRNKDMEDVGNDIFHTLVNNSLLQDVEKDEYGYNIDGCKMHDLVHDLSSSLSKYETSHLVCPRVKHLSEARTLQALFLRGEVVENISFQNFKCLRILNLAGRRSLEKIHDSIGELVHLRYLDLSCTAINVLPKSVGKLYHLQTLKLRVCYHLKDIPEDVSNLISLRHFEFDGVSVSPKVGQLTSLRTLSSFGVGQGKGCQIKELGRMKHLRGKLRICNLEEINSREDAAESDLSGKKKLFEIEFCWGNNKGANRNDKDVLEGLQPPANVKILEIKNFSGDSFPAWATEMAINFEGKWTPLDKLVRIRLSGCCSCHYLPILGNLPLLRELELVSMDKLRSLSSSLGQGNDVVGSRKPLFPLLRRLLLQRMKSLEKWTDTAQNSSTMLSPVLEKLTIWYCPKIILLDEYHCHPLVSLDIWRCDNLESIRSIQGLTSLESLRIIDCPSLLEIPDLHNQGHSLKYLEIGYCNEITSLPSGFDCLALVNEMRLGRFSNELHCFPSLEGIEKLSNHLRSLELKGWDHWESIPEEVKHLTALTSLTIEGFGMLRELPSWLTNLSSIRELTFRECKRLDSESVKQGAPREADVRVYNY